MNCKTALLTTVFPMDEAFLVEFFDSLRNQTCKYFDVIVVNDGYEGFKSIIERYSDLNIIELKFSSTASKNREYGINYVIRNKYDILIFGDSDDYFSENRIQVVINKLKNCDVIVNDITLFDEERVINSCYISNRVTNDCEINLEYIKEKNIFGMTNTAVNVNSLNEVSFDDSLVAVDWFFYSVLLSQGKKASFTNEAVTFYRQYSSNTVGLGRISEASISKAIEVKLKHYKLMMEINPDYESLYNDVASMQKKQNLIKISNQNSQNLFWWEEVRSKE